MKQVSNINYKEIYLEILKASGYSDIELKGSSRKREIGDKRSAVACIMRDNGCYLKDIAKVLNRVYSTVYISYLNNREYVKEEIERIKNNMNLKK